MTKNILRRITQKHPENKCFIYGEIYSPPTFGGKYIPLSIRWLYDDCFWIIGHSKFGITALLIFTISSSILVWVYLKIYWKNHPPIGSALLQNILHISSVHLQNIFHDHTELCLQCWVTERVRIHPETHAVQYKDIAKNRAYIHLNLNISTQHFSFSNPSPNKDNHW